MLNMSATAAVEITQPRSPSRPSPTTFPRMKLLVTLMMAATICLLAGVVHKSFHVPQRLDISSITDPETAQFLIDALETRLHELESLNPLSCSNGTSTLNIAADPLLNETERIEYLLGPWSTRKFQATNQDFKRFLSEHRDAPKYQKYLDRQSTDLLALDGRILHQSMSHGYVFVHFLLPFAAMLKRAYSSGLAGHCKAKPGTQVIERGGDQYEPHILFPVFSMTRGLGGGAIPSMAMTKERHWGAACAILSGEQVDPQWEDKKAVAIWRGQSTGGFEKGIRSTTTENNLPPRHTFVRQYFGADPRRDGVDVGFSGTCQGWEREWNAFRKPVVTVDAFLEHKYLISIQGNDVASNVKWVMASNSVLFMPRPNVESWALEGTLVAGVHYVELTWNETTGWNLEDQIRFCIENDAKCKEIAMNSKRFIEHYRFCDDQYQQEIEAKLMDRYCEQVTIQLTV